MAFSFASFFSRFLSLSLRRSLTLSAVLWAAALAMSATAAERDSRNLYRYVNEQGVKVLAYQVPPQFVSGGYEVLSTTGAVIEIVPKQLDESEIDSLDGKSRRAAEAAEEAERLRKWDESLLLRYSSIDDIEAARNRELRDLKIRVNILKGKLRSLKQQVENYQSVAADQQRLGLNVDEQHLKAMDDLRGEIDSTQRAIVDRENAIASVDADYDRDVERFTSLLDIVEMRRTMSAKPSSGRRADSLDR
ncbi:MAG: hypothetical protein AAF671_13405 [Pseudomonadota bacterium]